MVLCQDLQVGSSYPFIYAISQTFFLGEALGESSVPDRKDQFQEQCIMWQKLHPVTHSMILCKTEELFCQISVAKTLTMDLR